MRHFSGPVAVSNAIDEHSIAERIMGPVQGLAIVAQIRRGGATSRVTQRVRQSNFLTEILFIDTV
jgi:hypothetical protein